MPKRSKKTSLCFSDFDQFARNRVQHDIAAILASNAVHRVRAEQVQAGQVRRPGLSSNVRRFSDPSHAHRAQRFLQGEPAHVWAVKDSLST